MNKPKPLDPVHPAPPLSERMRPRTIDEFVGQDHLLGPGKLLRKMIESGDIYSIILWGPPGTGKTTIAQILAGAAEARFIPLSAVTSGIRDVKKVIEEAKEKKKTEGIKTILFIDEIHRFNKAQQDAFLPHVEQGNIVLIGATTENPSFEVISPLLSRSKVLVLKQLSIENIITILKKAILDRDRGLGSMKIITEGNVLELIASFSHGDARTALNTLEIAVMLSQPEPEGEIRISETEIYETIQKKSILYDKTGEEHYNIISALHKSLRGSDADASLYWLGRMLEAGEDPLYIARRLIRFASEDIGNADPRALQVTLNAKDAIHFIGLPEGKLALAQACIYLATAPKSNSVYTAYTKVASTIKNTGPIPVPLHLRNAPTNLMKNLGYGKNYRYEHNCSDAISEQDFLPDKIRSSSFYHPSERGFEKIIKERIEYIKKKKAEKKQQSKSRLTSKKNI